MLGLERKRRWGMEEKLRILAQSVAPGSSPTLTCKLHGISSGQLYTWRKQFRRGDLTGFVPASIAQETPALPAPDPMAEAPPLPNIAATSSIEVDLPNGIKLRIPRDVDEAALRLILSALS
jgi:transposase